MPQDDTLQNNKEREELIGLLDLTNDVEGECAEVGVYLGGSAEIIYGRMNKNKRLYLFDTFMGFESLTEFDPIEWKDDRKHWLESSKLTNAYDYVVNRFKERNVEVVKGPFNESIDLKFKDMRFSFVHLDADAYEPTKNAVGFFYPRMNSGGIMVFHDYRHINAPVKLVCDEFFKDKPETVLDISSIEPDGTGGSQGYVIKE